jgi:hypothetical protein
MFEGSKCPNGPRSMVRFSMSSWVHWMSPLEDSNMTLAPPLRPSGEGAKVCERIASMDHSIYPIGSMYAIYGNIYHQYTPNVSMYTIHGSCGYDLWLSYLQHTALDLDRSSLKLCVWLLGSVSVSIPELGRKRDTSLYVPFRLWNSHCHLRPPNSTCGILWVQFLSIIANIAII